METDEDDDGERTYEAADLPRIRIPCGHDVDDVDDVAADVWVCGKCRMRLLASDLMVVERRSQGVNRERERNEDQPNADRKG